MDRFRGGTAPSCTQIPPSDLKAAGDQIPMPRRIRIPTLPSAAAKGGETMLRLRPCLLIVRLRLLIILRRLRLHRLPLAQVDPKHLRAHAGLCL